MWLLCVPNNVSQPAHLKHSAILGTCPIFSLAMSVVVKRWATHEREYIQYKEKFVKRSLAPHEYSEIINDRDRQFYSYLNKMRIKNEAECIEFIKENTTIPVPEILDAYEKDDGSFILETKLIDGVEMEQLSREDQKKAMPQVRQCLEILRRLESEKLGGPGPSGFIWQPQTIFTRSGDSTSWSLDKISEFVSENKFVFCHRDLSQANIFFHPTTLELLAITDWENGGYYPANHELLFFQKAATSGAQAKTIHGIEEVKEFWRKAAC